MKIALIADFFEGSGFGHFFRLKSFYDMFKDSYLCKFFLQTPINVKVENEVYNATNFLQIIKDFNPKIAIIDGYSFKPELRLKLKEIGIKTMFVDDFAKGYYPDDFVINHANNLDESRYEVPEKTKLLLGSNYALMRPEFLAVAKTNKEKVSSVKFEKVFISFGGADPNNLLSKYLNFLAEIPFVKQIIALGKNNESISILAKNKTQFVWGLKATELINQLKNVDFAIVPASTLSYELCCLRIPFITGYFIENQKLIYHGLIAKKCAVGLGNLNEDYNLLKAIEELDCSKNEILINQILYFDGNTFDRLKSKLIV